MSNQDLNNKIDIILNSDYSIENKLEQIFFDLKPTGTREEKITFILYWFNLLLENDDDYNKITYHDIEYIIDVILELIDKDGEYDYSNYYAKVNVVMNKIMKEIIRVSSIEVVNDKIEDVKERVKLLYSNLTKLSMSILEKKQKIKDLKESIENDNRMISHLTEEVNGLLQGSK